MLVGRVTLLGAAAVELGWKIYCKPEGLSLGNPSLRVVELYGSFGATRLGVVVPFFPQSGRQHPMGNK